MPPLQSDDRFIVNRGSATYKTTFENIKNSLDLAYDYTGVVNEAIGGTILSFTISGEGLAFLKNQAYTATSPEGHDIEFTAQEVGPNGELLLISIVSNNPGLVDGEIFSVNPFSEPGELLSVSNGAGFPTDIALDVSDRFDVYQAPYTDALGNTISPYGGQVIVTGTGIGNEPTVELVARGLGYDPTQGDISVARYDVIADDYDYSYLLNATVVTQGDVDDANNLGEITVDSVSDGSDADKILLTVQIGSDPTTAKTVTIAPGDNINFENVGPNEVKINSVGGDNGADGEDTSTNAQALVFVAPDPPSPPSYNVENGSLWYHTQEGRLYVAVSYLTTTAQRAYEWIDASPSSLNDCVRKTGDDMTGDLNINGASLYTPHYDLERLPLISSVS